MNNKFYNLAGEISKLLDSHYVRDSQLHFTGSRYHRDSTHFSDYDLLFFVPKNLLHIQSIVESAGFSVVNGSAENSKEILVVRRISDINANLIFTNNKQVFEAWKEVDYLCKKLKPSKGKRKVIFDTIINGDILFRL